MCRCPCVRGHVRSRASSCAHACASDHMCVQACVRCGEPSMCKLRRATLHYWPAGVPQCMVQPVLSVTDNITVVPSTHTSLKFQLQRATLCYWPAGAPQCIVQPVLNVPDKITVVPSTHTSFLFQCTVQPVLNVPDKITVVPSTHTSPKLQPRRATLHYWPAGAPQCIVQPELIPSPE